MLLCEGLRLKRTEYYGQMRYKIEPFAEHD
jgi:hypothetical protein